MKSVHGWAFPDADDFMCHQIDEQGHYQYDNLLTVLGLVKGRDTVVDGGAHVGTWTRVFSEQFKHVIAFEPSPDTYEALAANVVNFGSTNVTAHNAALGAACGTVTMILDPTNTEKQNTGGRRIQPNGVVPMVTVDSLALDVLDFLKLDVEGSEPAALLGARATIARCKPVVLFENKKLWQKYYGMPADAPISILQGYGYRKLGQARRDEIWGPG